jgi:hypothetical protein
LVWIPLTQGEPAGDLDKLGQGVQGDAAVPPAAADED